LSLAGVLLLTLVGCAEDVGTGATSPTQSPTVTPTPTESPAAICDEPAQTTIGLVAKNFRFNFKCLTVPAREPLQVEFVNKDTANHNLSIYTLDFSSEFTGDVAYPAETFRYEVPALEEGEYLFQCDIHPTDMSGPLIVE
jgi:plastocyanin